MTIEELMTKHNVDERAVAREKKKLERYIARYQRRENSAKRCRQLMSECKRLFVISHRESNVAGVAG